MDASLEKLTLPSRAARIQCLDIHGQEIKGASASGFVCVEHGVLFLYTCWHVVTGFNMHNIESKRKNTRRRIRVTLQNAVETENGVEPAPGIQEIELPLYDESVAPPLPLWWQDKLRDDKKCALTSTGLHVPNMHDVVKMKLPEGLCLSAIHSIHADRRGGHMFFPAGQLLIAGFPYGYNSLGHGELYGIVLTRFIAAIFVESPSRLFEILLDGAGAPGMSGGPVFAETPSGLRLVGIYTGLIYPDHAAKRRQRVTVLGTICNMENCWTAGQLVPYSELMFSGTTQ